MVPFYSRRYVNFRFLKSSAMVLDWEYFFGFGRIFFLIFFKEIGDSN